MYRKAVSAGLKVFRTGLGYGKHPAVSDASPWHVCTRQRISIEMNFLTHKHIDRRTVLRGLGAAIPLPALDAMFPALASSPKPPRRLAVVYVPNGIIMKDWKIATTGQDFAFTRILKPLEPFRQEITVLSGLANRAAEKGQGGGHAKATGSFLSGAAPKYTAGPDVHAGVTFDQLVARHWGSQVRVSSLQIGCEDSRMVGNCDTGSS